MKSLPKNCRAFSCPRLAHIVMRLGPTRHLRDAGSSSATAASGFPAVVASSLVGGARLGEDCRLFFLRLSSDPMLEAALAVSMVVPDNNESVRNINVYSRSFGGSDRGDWP